MSRSCISKRGIAKGASRLLVAASKVPPPLVASIRVEPEAKVVELLAAQALLGSLRDDIASSLRNY